MFIFIENADRYLCEFTCNIRTDLAPFMWGDPGMRFSVQLYSDIVGGLRAFHVTKGGEYTSVPVIVWV